MSTVAVVTGVSTGLGFATTEALLRNGWRVVGVSRDADRSARAAERLRPVADAAGGSVELVQADLSSLAGVRALAGSLPADRIDVLIHGAGGLFSPRRETVDGHEMTLALNHDTPFLLTWLLRDRLGPAPRILSLNSRFHARGRIDFDDLDRRGRRYSALGAYAAAKLANLLFMTELARRLPDAVVNAVFPGDVYTNAVRNTGPVIRGLYHSVGRLFLISAEKGAETIVWAAADPAAAHHSGQLLYRRAPIRSSSASRDPALAERLWTATAERTGAVWN